MLTEKQKASRKESNAKKKEVRKEAYQKLKAELIALKASDSAMALLTTLVTGSREPTVSHILQLFGVRTPEKGTIVTLKEAGMRGPKGERMNRGESFAQFVARVQDIDEKKSLNAESLRQRCNAINRQGKHKVVFNSEAGTITFVS